MQVGQIVKVQNTDDGKNIGKEGVITAIEPVHPLWNSDQHDWYGVEVMLDGHTIPTYFKMSELMLIDDCDK